VLALRFGPRRAGVFDSTAVTTRKCSSVDGFVVFDLGVEVPAAGIVRTAPKVLVDGAGWLARSQTYQFASFERRVGGASAAVNAQPDVRVAALEGFAAEVAPEIAAGTLLLEPGRGLTTEASDALRALDPRPALWWEHRHELRAVGVAAAVSASGDPSGRRVAIEGFDDAGPHLVAELVEAGAVVVAVSTTAGTASFPTGLPADVAGPAWAAHGPGFVAELGVDPVAPAEVFTVDADVLVVGSKVGVLDHEVASSLAATTVVPSGALPVTAKALASLRRAGVVVLADFVTTAGPLAAWPTEGDAPDLDGARAAARASVAGVLAEVADHPSGPLLGACERAETFLGTWVDALPFGRPIA
jgi:glutamate dehydrogenase/leucine dehydrogenase